VVAVSGDGGGGSRLRMVVLPLLLRAFFSRHCVSFLLFSSSTSASPCSFFIICWWRWQRLGLRTVAGKPSGSCFDGGSAAVLLLCYVFLPLFISVFFLLLLFLTVQVLLSTTGRNGNGGVAAQLFCQPVLLFSFFFTVLQ